MFKHVYGSNFARILLISFFAISCGSNESELTQNKQLNSKLQNIVGGQNVAQGQGDIRELATVALTTELSRSGKKSLLESGHSFCSGTIIAKRVIVTAAHCLQKMDGKTRKKLDELVLPNETDFLVYFDNKVQKGGKWIRAEKVIPHPDWSPDLTLSASPASPPNDFGIIILESDIPEDRKIAEIAEEKLDISSLKAHLVGFGVTQSRNNNDTGIKRQVSVPVKNVTNNNQRVEVGEFFKGACAGDSGGPMYVENNGKFQLVGATSTGAEFAGYCIGVSNNYTDVRFYKKWIESNL